MVLAGVALASASGLVAPGMSHAKGREDIPLLTTTIYSTFAQQARASRERRALVLHDRRVQWSFGELLARVDRAATGLAAFGVRAQDRVGVWMPNNGEWLVTQLATAKLGSILVNINPDYRLPELEFALNLVGCKLLILAPSTPQMDYVGMARSLCPELGDGSKDVACARVPSLRRILLVGGAERGMVSFEEVYRDGGGVEGARSCHEPVNIQFTSGTTGRPKATTLTHSGILNNAYFLGRTMRYTENDTICVPVPLYHCFGCVMGNLAMVSHGCGLVYPAARFDPHATLQAVAQHRCTSLYGVPTMFIAMLDHPQFSTFKFEGLRTGIMAGAPCPEATMNRVIHEMGAREMTICYGMTETSPVSWQTQIGTPVELVCSTVGQIHPHVECKVVDPDTCKVLPCGKPGELWVAGYGVMRGYWQDEAATKDTVVNEDGKVWMRTGDLAVITAAGFCEIVGRIKDMILRGGENIFPREVEECLMSLPDVAVAAVVGVPDEKLGEQVCAWIAWRGGAPSSQEASDDAKRKIREHLKERVAHFKVPKYIVFKDTFPLTVTGKTRKVEMREISACELGLVSPKSRL